MRVGYRLRINLYFLRNSALAPSNFINISILIPKRGFKNHDNCHTHLLIHILISAK